MMAEWNRFMRRPCSQARRNTEGEIAMRTQRTLGMVMLAMMVGTTTAGALDLTGTWQGTEKCTINSSTTTKFKNTVTLLITQTGSDLNTQLSGGLFNLKFNGYGHANTDKPDNGAAGLLYCTNSSTIGANFSLKAKTKPLTGDGTLKGIFIGVDSISNYDCTYTLKRVGTGNPVVSACP